VLRTFYGGKAFAKRRFLLARRKQAFEEQVINELIAKSERGSSTPAVFAYGDGQFASSMQGCHGGTPHARLRRLLAMKRRVVLVDEYLTTKRCPTCRCTTHLTAEERKNTKLYRAAFAVQPKGVASYTRKDGAVVFSYGELGETPNPRGCTDSRTATRARRCGAATTPRRSTSGGSSWSNGGRERGQRTGGWGFPPIFRKTDLFFSF